MKKLLITTVAATSMIITGCASTGTTGNADTAKKQVWVRWQGQCWAQASQKPQAVSILSVMPPLVRCWARALALI